MRCREPDCWQAYTLSSWPGKGELSTILDEGRQTLGVLCCNVAIGLSMFDGQLPIRAIGVVGDDHDGRLIREAFGQHPNISVDEIAVRGKTSYTLVLNDILSKERTFLQYRGSNASFCEGDINWALALCSMMHIGYIMLLDALDAQDELYGTKLARLLRHAQSLGIKTSVDVVSEAGNRYQALIPRRSSMPITVPSMRSRPSRSPVSRSGMGTARLFPSICRTRSRA